MKLLTVVVPCYNSAAYMDKAIDSLLVGGDELDILIVDDGSKDDTAAIADRYAAAHPSRVRVIHQPNGGHGSGINRCIETAQGIYMKVVDSDDRLDADGLRLLLDTLRQHTEPAEQVDLIVHDYVYDTTDKQATYRMSYRTCIPGNRVLGWADCHHFGIAFQFMIHSLVYRVELLRANGLTLPEHTFYKDNIYIYKPLPWVKKLIYLPRPVYGYNIGRADQSVNEANMVKRLDQLAAMLTRMATSWTLAELNAQPRPLRGYMLHNAIAQILNLRMLVCLADTPENNALLDKLWADIRDFDEPLYKKLRNCWVGRVTRFHTRPGKRILIIAYRIGRRIVHF